MARTKTPEIDQKRQQWPKLLFVGLLCLAIGFFVRGRVTFHEPLLSSKLLDWPFLTFVLLSCFVLLFYDALAAVISKGELAIAWGKDQSIQIKNLSSAVTGEVDMVRDEVDALKSDIERLKLELVSVRGVVPVGHLFASAEDDAKNGESNLNEARLRKLREALGNPKYKWRTIERLSIIIGAPEDAVITLLSTQDDVRLSRSIYGNFIAGLRSRVGDP